MCVQAEEHDEVKVWVLAVSVDRQVERALVTDSRGVYEASLVNPGKRVRACNIVCTQTAHNVVRVW
jgi:hypothetical protein